MRYIINFIIFLLIAYTIFGTGTRINEIKELAPTAMAERNWKILRYEGYEYGAWNKHGGKVWYHVKDLGHKNTYYRVNITLWGDELHFYYGKPEPLNRINFDNGDNNE